MLDCFTYPRFISFVNDFLRGFKWKGCIRFLKYFLKCSVARHPVEGLTRGRWVTNAGSLIASVLWHEPESTGKTISNSKFTVSSKAFCQFAVAPTR